MEADLPRSGKLRTHGLYFLGVIWGKEGKKGVLNDPYGNISAAAPPRAIASQWGEPMGLLPRTGAKTKIEQTEA